MKRYGDLLYAVTIVLCLLGMIGALVGFILSADPGWLATAIGMAVLAQGADR